MTILITENFVVETCCNCGINYAVTQGFYELCQREKSQRSFYCPNGHSQYYTGESDAHKAARLARELEAARDRENTMRLAKEREWKLRRQAEGKTRALQKRVAHGVCPCCQRTFQNLAAHIKTKHPTFAQAQEVA